MANFTSLYFFEALAKGEIDLAHDALGMLLVDATCTVTELHKYLADIPTRGELPTGTGYTRKVLTGQALIVDTTNKKVSLTADIVSWASINVTPAVAAALLYKDGAGDALRLMIGKYDDGGFPAPATGGVPIAVIPSVTDGFLLIKKGV
jgi:hypothetical protein